MRYTVIAYKESGATTCRGCVMDQWDSDMETRTFVDKDTAIDWASDFHYKSDTNLGHYRLTYLINGFPLDYYDFDGECDDDYYDLSDAHSDMDSKARELAAKKYQEYKSKIEAERVAAEQKQQQHKKEQELKLLAELKEKYGQA